VSQQAADDHQELRDLFRPTETLRVLDEFATWVFGTTAVVGAIGCGLGLSTLDHLDHTGKQVYLVAVICTRMARILAPRAPRAVRVNPDQRESLRTTFERIVKQRYAMLPFRSGVRARSNRRARFRVGSPSPLCGERPSVQGSMRRATGRETVRTKSGGTV
jgi:hypothetical protein